MTASTPPTRSDDPLVRIEQKLDALSLQWDNKFDSISTKVEALSGDVEALSGDVEALSGDVEALADKMERSNDKFDNYQKATQWVVQLAFTLIASATITVIVSSVLSSR
jgi:outer membrane murein-binding lipoprotein Lpp